MGNIRSPYGRSLQPTQAFLGNQTFSIRRLGCMRPVTDIIRF